MANKAKTRFINKIHLLFVVLLFFVCITGANAAPFFKELVNDKERLAARVLTADDSGTYPVPKGLPQGWRSLDHNKAETIGKDFFDLGQVDLKEEHGSIIIYVRLSHHFRVYNPSFTREEFKKRVERIKELKEIKLEIDPSVEKLLID